MSSTAFPVRWSRPRFRRRRTDRLGTTAPGRGAGGSVCPGPGGRTRPAVRAAVRAGAWAGARTSFLPGREAREPEVGRTGPTPSRGGGAGAGREPGAGRPRCGERGYARTPRASRSPPVRRFRPRPHGRARTRRSVHRGSGRARVPAMPRSRPARARRSRSSAGRPMRRRASGARAPIDPRAFQPRFALAVMLERRGASEEAEESYRLAIDLQPEAAPAWVGLGNAERAQGRDEEARESYRRGDGGRSGPRARLEQPRQPRARARPHGRGGGRLPHRGGARAALRARMDEPRLPCSEPPGGTRRRPRRGRGRRSSRPGTWTSGPGSGTPSNGPGAPGKRSPPSGARLRA